MKIETIYLNASLDATLDFEQEKKLAAEAIKNGSKLSFEIDLGLFSKLKKPLSNQSQYLSLELSLQHFKETFFQPFQDEIVDVCLYSGSLDFTNELGICDNLRDGFQSWIDERFLEVEEGKNLDIYFLRDACLEYLHILRANMPDEMPLSLKLDAKSVTDPLCHALLTHREVFEPFNLVLTNQLFPEDKKSKIAICLPAPSVVQSTIYEPLQDVFQYLVQNKMTYRLIPEAFLISEWDLVDYLFVLSSTLKKEGRRKLQGFAAAGGIIVTLGAPIGLPGEITYQDFCNVTQAV